MLHFLRDFNPKEQVLGLVKLKGEKTPVLDLFRSNGDKLLAKKVFHYEKFQVLEDGVLTQQLDNSATTLNVNKELAEFLSEGYLISIGDEYFLVEKTNPSAKTIIVKGRGYGDSPVSSHEVQSTIYVISKVEGEGVITDDYKKTLSKEVENYLQEITNTISITQLALDLSQKDAVHLESEETAAKLNQQAQELEKTVLYGKGGNNGDKSSMSGLKDLMLKYSGNILDAEKDLTDDKLDLYFANLVNKGSSVNAMIVNPIALNKTFKKLQNTVVIHTDEQGRQIAGGVITGYMPSAMGGAVIRIIPSKTCRPNEIFIVDDKSLFFLPRKNSNTGEDRVFTVTKESNSSSAVVNKTIRTSGTIKVEGISKMGYITNLF